jgi:hypothetical protein
MGFGTEDKKLLYSPCISLVKSITIATARQTTWKEPAKEANHDVVNIGEKTSIYVLW